jgi:hypothetical protein
MTTALIDQLITAQATLIVALDRRDADAIETATKALGAAVAALRSQDAWRESGDMRERVSHALKQTDAARIRVNYLSDWTRQRIDSIAELRGGISAQTYAMPYKTKENSARA